MGNISVNISELISLREVCKLVRARNLVTKVKTAASYTQTVLQKQA